MGIQFAKHPSGTTRGDGIRERKACVPPRGMDSNVRVEKYGAIVAQRYNLGRVEDG